MLASAFEKSIKDNGFGDASLVNRPHLTFMYSDTDSDAPGYYLVAVKDLDDNRGYAKEMPDASWREWDNAAMAWVDIEDTAPPVIHAKY